jgi:serine/threonine protein kinase/tetratricopeptide (TPR) repeat protein
MAAPKLDEAAIFNAARQIETPETRRLYIQEACGEDHDLQRRVEALLRAHEEEQTFLNSPTKELRSLLDASTAVGLDTSISPYRLIQRIGEGGMGTVFLADQTQPIQRQVAIKIVRPGMDSRQVIARFEAERQALALMDHPHIAKVLDAGTTPASRPYFVMELIRGVPITQYCDGNRLALRERLRIFVPVCQAVQHAHQKGIIHRDLKPSNVLITRYDGKAVPKIIDFGIAKAIGVRLTERTLSTEIGSVVGTPEYMSPEQAEPGQLDIDTGSDIYSLGAMLYELLTGTTPLQPELQRGTDLLDRLRIVREAEPPKPSTRLSTTEELPAIAANRAIEPKKLTGQVQGDLDWIVMKCLEKDRTRRYATANALARDLERYLNEEPVEACPPSAGYRLGKFASKHRKLLLGAGAFVLLLTAGVVVSSWLAVLARAAEREALSARDGEAEQRRQAERSAAESEAMLKFFRNWVLAAARPKGEEGGLGKDATIRAALDKAEPQIAKEFAGQPLVEANIRHTLAQTYSHLAEQNLAARQQERALALYRQELGPEHPDTMGAMNNLAIMLIQQGRSEAARALFEEVVQLQQSVLGLEDPRTLQSMNNLANVLWSMKLLAEARKLYEEVLPLQRRIQGSENLDTLRSMSNLANVLSDQGHLQEARKLYEEALHIQENKWGSDHPQTLGMMNNLAIMLEKQGQHKQARQMYEKLLHAEERVLGKKHLTTLATMNNLAKLLEEQGQFEDARRRYEETLLLQRSALRPGHPEMLRTMNNLAWMLATATDAKARDPRRAVELAKELVQHSPKQGDIWNTLGVASYRAGDWSSAIAALEKSEELAPGQFLGYNALFLAMAYWQRKEPESARQWYDRAVRWMEKNQPSDPEILQYRTEAAHLLGLPTPKAPVKKDGK